MVSFLTSISSNDYARLRSRIIVISCNIFVYILCSKLVFPRIPVLAMTNDDTYMACYPTIVQYAIK